MGVHDRNDPRPSAAHGRPVLRADLCGNYPPDRRPDPRSKELRPAPGKRCRLFLGVAGRPGVKGSITGFDRIKKAFHQGTPFLLMVLAAGFEPATPSFGGKYSIHLSYASLMNQ